MPNFVMLNLPDFVLIEGAPELEPRRPEDAPVYLNPKFNDLLRTLGVCMDTCEETDRLVFRKEQRARLQGVLDQYGFARMPRTVGELGGLFDYCDRLDALTGTGMFTAELQAQWQRLSLELCPQRQALPAAPAVEMYRCSDRQGLRRLHTEQDTLTVLGRLWRFVPGR